MAHLRSLKIQIKSWLSAPDWRSHLPEIVSQGMSSMGPLMGLLMYEPQMRLRAAIAIGAVTAELNKTRNDLARDVLRRLKWRLSEESGNIGWGVPEAFGEIVAQCPELDKEFHSILFSTILDLGFDDNYVDNDVLRRSCYFAIGRVLEAAPQYGNEVRPLLRKGLADTDMACRGYAAWALGKLGPDLNDGPALRHASEEGNSAVCLIVDGDTAKEYPASELARMALGNR